MSKIEEMFESYKQDFDKWTRLYLEHETEKGLVYGMHVPFVDHFGGNLSFYLSHQKDKIILTDGGCTISDLLMSGVDIKAVIPTINNILANHEISLNSKDNEIFLEMSEEDFKDNCIQNFVQCLILVSGLVYDPRNIQRPE